MLSYFGFALRRSRQAHIQDGIEDNKADADETVAAVGYIAREGMRDTDKKILSVMLS